jgi:histone H3/H4
MALSILAFERIAKNAGIKRISKDAVEELRDLVEEHGFEIAHKSVRISAHANRRTVKKRDIDFAAGKM